MRYRMTPDDVASYVVHPRTGNAKIDAHNERTSDSERRLVDEADPLHRPLFVLTPKLEVVRYDFESGEQSVADLRPATGHARGRTVQLDR